MDVPDWLVVGALVTLPDLDNRTAKHGNRYRVVHVKRSELVATGIEVGVQPVDASEYKHPKCISLNHCERVEDRAADQDAERRLPPILA